MGDEDHVCGAGNGRLTMKVGVVMTRQTLVSSLSFFVLLFLLSVCKGNGTEVDTSAGEAKRG